MAIKIQGNIVLDHGSGLSNNVIVGVKAGSNLTSTSSNTVALGFDAGRLLTSGNNNVLVGNEALQNNSIGAYNTVVGSMAAYNATGSFITAIGYNALFNLSTGEWNTAVGTESQLSTTTGQVNSSLGYQALAFNDAGSRNTAVGYRAAYSNTTGTDNTAVGRSALFTNQTGIAITAMGSAAALLNTASYTTAFGHSALVDNTTGTLNSAFGAFALQNNTTGSSNVGIGIEALSFNITGSFNTAVGFRALYSATVSNNNTAVGFYAAYFTTASNTTAVGYSALFNNSTGTLNNAFGAFTLNNNTTGVSNVGIGSEALYGNVTGSYNLAIGYRALYNANSSYNIGIGHMSLLNSRTSSGNNIALGVGSGALIYHGSNNIIIGPYTGATAPISGNGNNWIVISDGLGNIRQVVDPQGNVGIGLTNPTANLHVAGTANITGNFIVNGGSIFVDATTNEVGIGTDLPANTLDVFGETSISGNLFIGSANLGSSTDTRTLELASNGFAILRVLGDRSNLAGEPGGSAVLLAVDGTGSGFAGVLSAVQGNGQRGDGGSYTDTLSNALLLGSITAGRPLQLGAAGSVRVTLDAQGNVGIGTTTPTANLQVVGTNTTNTVNVVGNVSVSGIIYASTFEGYGTGFANMNVISTVGSAIWNVPSGVRRWKVTAVGGGGAGGGALGTAGHNGNGGGSGGVTIGFYDYVPGVDTMALNVGRGGPYITTLNANGFSGNSTNVNYNGVFLFANGGTGGANSWFGGNVNAIGVGGAALGGTINLPGDDGGGGGIAAATNPLYPEGGHTPLGFGEGGVIGPILTGANGTNASGFGAGGGPGRNTSGTTLRTGGSGANGVVIIEW